MNSKSIASVCFVLIAALVASSASAYPYAEPESGGFWLGRVNLSPTLAIGVFYDSNPDEVNESQRRIMEETLVEEDGKDRYESSTGFYVKPGVLLQIPGNRWSLSGGVHYTYEDDDSDYSRSPKDWDEYVRLQGKTEGQLEWELGQSWQQLSYQQFDDFSQDDREALTFYGRLGLPVSDKTDVSLGASYRTLDYEDELLYDSDYMGVTLAFDHHLTDKTDFILALSYGINSADYDDIPEDEQQRMIGSETESHQAAIQVGLGSRASEKLTYRALVGLALFDPDYYEDETGEPGVERDPVDDDTEYNVSYDLSLSWRATDRLSVNLAGRTAYESAEDIRNNALLAYMLSCSANYRMFTRLRLSAGVSYRLEDYLRKVEVGSDDGVAYAGTDDERRGVKREDDQVSVFGDVTYGINRYASVFVNGLYSATSSTIDDFDYDRYRISAGVALQY
ncbi:MAG: outer membrane beta-barrel protein [Lentisphaerae bacterium]|nr:outer membrane beta-barrel protein [Lentisphaerota bacterium]